jgi:hypothetical protein
MATKKLESTSTSQALQNIKYIAEVEQSPFWLSPARNSTLDPLLTTKCTDWLRNVYTQADAYVEGDDLGTAFASCGVVLLTLAFTRSSSLYCIARVTGFPSDFVELVVRNMHESRLWESERWLDLLCTVENNTTDYFQVGEAIHSTLEEFWMHSLLPDLAEESMARRDGYLFGGQQQTWFDQEAGCPRERCQRAGRCNCAEKMAMTSRRREASRP